MFSIFISNKCFLKVLQVILVQVLIVVTEITGFKQNGFVLTFERCELVSYNPEYTANTTVTCFKYNRTYTAGNASFVLLKDISLRDVKLQVQAYKFASNEYREFPILFSTSFCESVGKNDFGLQGLYKCGNFPKCPMAIKGHYSVCNFAPDVTYFPPHIPDGSYMLDLKLFHGPTEVAFVRGYGTVKTKNKWEMK